MPHFQAIVSNSLGVYGARPTGERGSTMKRLLSVVVVAFFALAPLAHADSILNINITYVTAFMSPNNGSGDNISFTLIGLGTTITGIGGMACFSWCNGPIPDLNSVATSQIFISNFLSATVGGIAYDPNNDMSFQSALFSSSGGLNGSLLVSSKGDGSVAADLSIVAPA